MPLAAETQRRLSTALASTGCAVELLSAIQVGAFDSGNAVYTAAGDIVMAVGQKVAVVNKTSGAATQVTLPATPTQWQKATIIDGKGDAATNNITVVAGGSSTIDAAVSPGVVINTNYGAAEFMFNGTEWNLINLDTTGIAGNQVIGGTLGVTGAATLSSTLAVTGATQLTGAVSENAAAGAAGSSTRLVKNLSAMANAADVALFTITIPNVLAGAAVRVFITGSLGDGDSTDSGGYLIGVSRIAGANALAVAGTKYGTAATTGATGNATVIITVPAVAGGVTASNTFVVTARVTRSAGTATNHFVTAEIEVLNGKAGGVTIS